MLGIWSRVKSALPNITHMQVTRRDTVLLPILAQFSTTYGA